MARLPRLATRPAATDEPRVAAVARVYLDAVDGTFSAPTFHAFMQAVQAHEPLNVDELWSVGTFLKFALLELILGEAREVLRPHGKVSVPRLLAHIKSLQSISNADWIYLIEPLIVIDALLRQDPANVFRAGWTLRPASSTASASRLLPAGPIAANRKWRRLALELAREGSDDGVRRILVLHLQPRTRRLLPYWRWDFSSSLPASAFTRVSRGALRAFVRA
jgi:hypothetical protein